MNFDKIFETIDHLYERNKHDEDFMSLVSDFYQFAIEYTKCRVDWNFYSLEQRNDNNKYRTSKHDRFIMSYNSLVRYLGRTMDISDFDIGEDRKVYGDLANYVVYQLALKQR